MSRILYKILTLVVLGLSLFFLLRSSLETPKVFVAFGLVMDIVGAFWLAWLSFNEKLNSWRPFFSSKPSEEEVYRETEEFRDAWVWSTSFLLVGFILQLVGTVFG